MLGEIVWDGFGGGAERGRDEDGKDSCDVGERFADHGFPLSIGFV